jgi:amino acid transporter
VGPIVATSALGLVAMFAIAAGSAIRLRRLQPDAPRSFKIPGGVKTAWLALALSLGLMVISLGHAVAEAGGFPLELAVLTGWAILGVGVAARGAGEPARADEWST